MNEPPESTPEYQAVLLMDQEARAKLPELVKRAGQLQQQLAEVSEALSNATNELREQLAHVIVGHSRAGQTGITHMADGSLLYWIPDPQESPGEHT